MTASIRNVSLNTYDEMTIPSNTRIIRILDSKSVLESYPTRDSVQTDVFVFKDVNANENGFITVNDCVKITSILQDAINDNISVIVHCHMGVSRSGAVAQFAVDHLGFKDGINSQGWGRTAFNTQVYNALVKHGLGLTNSWD